MTKKQMTKQSYWNDEALDMLMGCSFVGGACIVEYTGGEIQVLKANAQYVSITSGGNQTFENTVKFNWLNCADEESRHMLEETIEKAAAGSEELFCIVKINSMSGIDKDRYIRIIMRSVAKRASRQLIYCMMENITEQKERELREKEATSQLQAILKNINGGVTAVYIDEEGIVRFIFANDQYFEMVGVERSTYEGGNANIFEIIHPDDRDEVIRKTCEAECSGESFSCVFRVMRPDGRLIWQRCDVSLTTIDGINRPVQISVSTDVTAMKLAEQREQEAYEQLHMIMQNVNGGVSVATLINGRIGYLYTNDEYYRMFGYTREQFESELTAGLSDIILPEDLLFVLRSAEQCEETGESSQLEFRVKKRDGKVIWVRSISSVCCVGGITQPLHIAVISDITEERNEKEKARIREEEKSVAMAQVGKVVGEYDIETRMLKLPADYIKKYKMPTELKDIPYNREYMDLILPEYRHIYISYYEAIIQGHKPDSIELQKCSRDGIKRWESFECAIIYGDNGDPYKAIISVEDITNQKELCQRYEREMQLRYKLVGDALLYYQLNLITGEIEEYYTTQDDIRGMAAGITTGEELRSNILANVAEEDRELVRCKLFYQGLYAAYKQGKTSVSIEYRRSTYGTGMHWVKASVTLLKRPNTETVVAFIYIKDIDFEKRSRLAINRIINDEIESVCIVDCVTGRAYMAKETSKPADGEGKQSVLYTEHISKYMSERVAAEDIPVCRSFLRLENLKYLLEEADSAIQVIRETSNELTLRRKRLKAFYLDSAKRDIVIAKSDITDLYEDEQHQKMLLQDAVNAANKANHAKSDFLSRMSHDIRTPLNAVLAFSDDELVQGASEKELHDYLKKIHYSGDYLLGIINDVLDMSKIEQNKVTLNPEIYTIDEFESTLAMVIGEMCKKKKIEFIVSSDAASRSAIMIDKIRFNQIFINLLSNAVKFTPVGGRIEFLIQHYTCQQEGYAVKRFIVRDNGIGMSKEFLPRAFDSFSQEYRYDVQQKNQGTGLGLSIVNELVRLMNGRIFVESDIGRGTTFTVELPIKYAEKGYTIRKQSNTERDKLKGMNILLCEDNEINEEIAVLLLEKYGCIVDCARNGKLGLECFEASEPGYYKAILMDIRMPVMNGIEASRAIRLLDREDARKVPIIAMTADAFAEDAMMSKEAGMNGHLSKPIEPQLMYKALIECFE